MREPNNVRKLIKEECFFRSKKAAVYECSKRSM